MCILREPAFMTSLEVIEALIIVRRDGMVGVDCWFAAIGGCGNGFGLRP